MRHSAAKATIFYLQARIPAVSFSVQERMIERILVPDAIPVEDEQLTSGHVSENHVLIEDIADPHKFILNGIGIDLFNVFDVNYVLGGVSEEERLLEDNLLCVWKELRVPAEVALLDPPSGDEGGRDQHRQESDVRAGSPSRESNEDCPVGVAPAYCRVGMSTLVQEFCVLVEENSGKAVVRIPSLGDGGGWADRPP